MQPSFIYEDVLVTVCCQGRNFTAKYKDKDLMRMHFYKPDKVAALFHQFAKPYQNYSARDGFHWNEYKRFITEEAEKAGVR